MNRKPLLIQALLGFLAAAAAGCAAERPAELVQTETRLAALSMEVDRGTTSDIALTRAEEELKRAQSEWRRDGSGPDLDHYLYLSNRRMDIAEAQRQTDIARNYQERIGDMQAANALGRARLREETVQAQADAYRAEMAKLQQALESQSMQQTPRGTEFAMTHVLFDIDSSTLRPGAERRLSALAAYLKQHPEETVTVEGYADSTGPSEYNDRLSQSRAESVKSALIAQGVQASRITTRGLGEAFPQASNLGEAGRLQNRSVLIVVNAQTSWFFLMEPGGAEISASKGASVVKKSAEETDLSQIRMDQDP